MVFLLDTNICLAFAHARSSRLLHRMEAQADGSMAMSAITYAELAVGARRSSSRADRENLEALIGIVRVLPFESAAAQRYGALVREIGVKRHSFDRLIAAHALAAVATLVTNNERDFTDVPGLAIENWTRP